MQPQTDDLLSFEQPPQEDLLSFEPQEDNAIVPHQQDNAIVPHEPQATKTQPSLYQTAFKVDYLGKRNKKSKQQVTWTFVKDNENHIGRYQFASRLSRRTINLFFSHYSSSVMLTWSTKTGKVLVHLDGEQVDQSQIKGYSIIHRKIELDNFGKIEIIASRTIPNKAAKDFLCYECIINGKAFSTLPVQQENRLLMETNEDGSGDQVLFGDDSAASDDDAEQELNEDYATPYYVEDIESVVDIVYPSGIPPYTPDT
jgi:hypothetical protein